MGKSSHKDFVHYFELFRYLTIYFENYRVVEDLYDWDVVNSARIRLVGVRVGWRCLVREI